TRKDAFKESDRQQWEQRWYLSPSAIAKHVGVDVSLVYHQWMKHGILVLGGRKPTESEQHEFGRGHYGRKKVTFLAESLADEIKEAYDNLPDSPTAPEG